jgi:hypothetical protein
MPDRNDTASSPTDSTRRTQTTALESQPPSPMAPAAIIGPITDPVLAAPASEPLPPGSETATQLTGAESGIWLVHTQSGTIHIFDLDARTVERRHGVNAGPLRGDEPRALRSIERCHLNESGYWTFQSHDFMTDFYWQVCTPIQRIERGNP